MSSTYDITEDEYLVREPQAEYKHEYRNGRMVAMSGASEAHNLIAVNIVLSLGPRLGDRPCKIFAADMRVKVASAHFYTYPDIAVVCGKTEFDKRDKQALVNPSLVVEVLSKATEKYDRGEKFGYYKKLPSLKEYILVAQDSVLVERYFLDEGRWRKQEYTMLEETVNFGSIGCEAKVSEFYKKVDV